MRKIGIFAGVFAVVAGLLATVAFMGFRGGNPATAVPQDTTTTTVVESTTTTSTTVPVNAAVNVCDMPRSYSTEYGLDGYEYRQFNATMWKEQGVTLVFEWTLSSQYDAEYVQFTEAVNVFSVYTGLNVKVIKGYDENAANIHIYESYLRAKERLQEHTAKGNDWWIEFYQEEINTFETKYDPTKLGINVNLDTEDRGNVAAYVERNGLTMGIMNTYIDKTFFVNGIGQSQWENDYMHTLLHELGHLVGLDHTHIDDDGINQEDSIMSYESNREPYYLAGDIAGLQQIFCKEEK